MAHLDDYLTLDTQLLAGREAQHSEAEDDALLERMDAVWRQLSDVEIAKVNDAHRLASDLTTAPASG